jgi:hypothetical protein
MKKYSYIISLLFLCLFACKDKEDLIHPPVATQATNIEDESFIANWDPYLTAEKFLLYVSEDAGFNTYLPGYEGKEVEGQSHLVEGLEPEHAYYYKVSAIIHGKSSEFSNKIECTTSESRYKLVKVVYKFTSAEDPELNESYAFDLGYNEGRIGGLEATDLLDENYSYEKTHYYRYDEKGRIKWITGYIGYTDETIDLFNYDKDGKVAWRYPSSTYEYSADNKNFSYTDYVNKRHYSYKRDENGNIIYYSEKENAVSYESFFSYNDIRFAEGLAFVFNESLNYYEFAVQNTFGIPEFYFPIWIYPTYNIKEQVIKTVDSEGNETTERITFEYEVNEHGLPTYRKATSDKHGDIVELYFYYTKNPGQNTAVQ